MSKEFLTAVEDRRTVYALGKKAVVSDARISEIVEFAVKHSPSSFNSQSARVVVLLDEQHDKFWDLTKSTLKAMVSEEQWVSTEQRLDGFKAGYGSVLFFEDASVVEGLQNAFPSYKDNFPIWSGHSSGMLQFVVWTALEAEGFGASLQHYNPLVDGFVQKEWNVPANWKLQAQLVFGEPVAAAGAKEFQPVSDRVKVYN
ncbi:nitroreductase family protein [Cohnella nanjingensis]|uniref:Nitroreductase family protein n=1 Tax=Cohnella nanjingensis TaxID=1387779 RepID=A0A7X0RW97_9BACL|nr:nitroreductase family protein [Cohnella nanjingensis]MBB6674837.1 nitroreductase family protein [Cohnella nanjingensis]